MTSGMSNYAAVLRNGRAARPFYAAVLARLPIAMAPLGLVLLVRAERGSYSLAGIVAGAFAVGIAFGSPLWGRALDRYGQPRVVLLSALSSAALLVAVTLLTASSAPDAVLPAVAALENALEPFGTRPHWGKVFGTAPATVAVRWPRLADFAALARRHDATGKFRNAVLETYLPG